MDSRIGRRDGAWAKKNGAAGFTARVAPVSSQAGVRLWGPPLHHTIAMRALQIGCRDGQWPKKIGVATMLERVALQQLEVVLELDLSGRLY